MSDQVASNPAAEPKTEKKPTRKRPFSRFRDLFFIRRFPKFFGGLPQEWVLPDDTEYQRQIHDAGFVSLDSEEYGDLSAHPIILQDLKDLDQHLLPTFFMLGQKARYYQNQFYMYQWVFITGAFLTTLFGTLALYLYGQVDASALAAQTAGDPLATALSYLTAIIGAVTAFYTTLSNRGEPRKRWSKVRRLTEETRACYFRYLAHLPPYDTSERVQRLREMAVAMQIKEQENV